MAENKILDELLIIKHDQITSSFMKQLFADSKNSKAKYKPNTHFLLPAGKYHNDKSTDTTVGRFIVNKFLFEPDGIIDLIGYQNIVITADGLGDIEKKMSGLLMDDKITTEVFSKFLNRIFWMGFNSAPYLNPSLDYDILLPKKKVEDRKKELIEKNKEELSKDNQVVATQITNELVGVAKEELKDSSAYRIYASGAKGSFANNYKNNTIGRGSIKSVADPTKFNVTMDNLVTGIKKENYPYFADLTVAASYGRAINTQVGGYEAKKYMNAYQSLVLGEKDSDCHSKGYVSILVTEFNKGLFNYRYMINGDKLVLITNENIKDYLGKVIKLRSPMFCTSEHICNKCAGELNYKLGIQNVGLTITKISGVLMNASMKAFHDSSLKVNKIDPYKYF